MKLHIHLFRKFLVYVIPMDSWQIQCGDRGDQIKFLTHNEKVISTSKNFASSPPLHIVNHWIITFKQFLTKRMVTEVNSENGNTI